MATYYHTVYSRGDHCGTGRRMYIMLYPNTSNELDAVKSGSPITTAIRDAADQLYEAGVIGYYDIQRFHAEKSEYNYPEIPSDSIDADFEDYLLGTTDDWSDYKWCTSDSCDSLKSIRGAHTLVHGYGCSTSLASAEGGTDNCYSGGCAWSRGVMAWTSTGCGSGLTRNSAIQEPLHQFIRAYQSGVQGEMCDADGDGEKSYYEEHTLGKLTDDDGDGNNETTPMLTYHENEHEGCCGPVTTWDGEYTQTLTSCTVDAVDYTAGDQCDPQNPNIC